MQFPNSLDTRALTGNATKDADLEWLLCVASALQASQQRPEQSQPSPRRQTVAAALPRSIRANNRNAA